MAESRDCACVPLVKHVYSEGCEKDEGGGGGGSSLKSNKSREQISRRRKTSFHHGGYISDIFFSQIAAALRARFSPTVAAINRVYRAIFDDYPDDNQQLWTTTSQTIEESKRCCEDIQIFHWVSNFYTTFAFGKYCPVYTYCLPILCFIRISAICLARRKNTLTKNT